MMTRLKRVHNVQQANRFGMGLFVLAVRQISTTIQLQRDASHVHLG